MCDLAWAAGFFEGEESIMLLMGGSSRRRLSVEISQIDREPLEWFRARWGGRIYDHAAAAKQGRAYSRWIVSTRQAAGFVVRSQMREKIVLALAFQEQKTSTWANRTEAYANEQERFASEMSALNRRGLTELERAAIAGR